MQFDLIVLGMELPGLLAAVRAAEIGRRVAVVNDPNHFRAPANETPLGRLSSAVSYFSGFAKFASDESLEIVESKETRRIVGERYLFACGDSPRRPAHVKFDGQSILDSDDVRGLSPIPDSVLIVGAGRHGIACARGLLMKGAKVSLADQRDPISGGAWIEDDELASCIHWETTVLGAERRKSSVMVFHRNGSIETYQMVVFAVGRLGCTEHLNLPQSKTLLDETGRFWCNEAGQTENPRFFAVGSVVGFPLSELSAPEVAERLVRNLFPGGISSANVPLQPHWRKRGLLSRSG
jgi:pyruvate/2-oxoglutarate dehydrogenase complex dihydrolipoamide dehydrogenase (E3) component